MSRPTAFSLCAVLAGAALVGQAGANPAGLLSLRELDVSTMADAIQSTVAEVFNSAVPSVVRVESDDEL